MTTRSQLIRKAVRKVLLASLEHQAAGGMWHRIPWSYPPRTERYADKLDTRVHGIKALKAYLTTGAWPDGEPPMLTSGRYFRFKDELERVLPPGMFSRVRW